MDDTPLPAPVPTAGLSDDDQARLKAELRPGERVLWTSVSLHDPKGEDEGCLVPVAAAAVLSWIVGLVGTFLALRPESVEGGMGVVLGVAGLIFGFMFTCGAFIAAWAAWRNRGKRLRRLYALTDTRAIFWEPGDGRSVVVSHLLHRQIRRVWRVEHPDGAGDVVIRSTVPGPQHDQRQTFFGLPDARRAEDLARTLSQRARRRRRSAPSAPLPDDDLGAPAPSQDPRP